jgi:hypothetical protein
MVDIMTALTTASQAMKLAQDLRNIDKAMDASEYKLKIADLTSAISDLKIALTDARDEIHAKNEEIKILEKTLARTAETIEVHGYRYMKNAEGGPTGHAFCPVCKQKEGYLFNLASGPGRNEFCPNCKGVFGRVAVYPY